MNIGVIGSGIVGQSVGGKLAELGHNVVLGTRDPANVDEKKGYTRPAWVSGWPGRDRTRGWARSPRPRPTARSSSTR